MPLFDAFVMVDWSAARRPVTGSDSIWWALVRHGDPEPVLEERHNPSTRHAATAMLAERLAALSDAGDRVLVGFDFPFGYPDGTAARLADGNGPADWSGVWSCLADALTDAEDNANDRFDGAAELNRRLTGEPFPFWGHDGRQDRPLLLRRGRRPHGPDDLAERRLCERRMPRTQPTWKLAGAGAVGGQALLGIRRVHQLRNDPRLAGRCRIWPFETGLVAPEPRPGDIVIAEVYPSLVAPDPEPGQVKDARQVRSIAAHFARADASDSLAPLFAGDPDLTPAERATVEREEAWILGVTGTTKAPTVRRKRRPAYETDPAAIYRQSFAAIRAEAALDRLPEPLRPVAVRLIHACGMTDLAADLDWSDGVAEAGRAALRRGAPILCDARMVAMGIIAARLPAANRVLCPLDDPRVPALANRRRTTRSAAAVELWADDIDGAVVAIGNAPTALFRLLELLDAAEIGRPAAILGFPVGFVGAAESKAELARDPCGIPFLTVHGRRGGSAMAAAAVNALASDSEE